MSKQILRPEETNYYQNKPRTQQSQSYAELWDVIAETLRKNKFVVKVPEYISVGLYSNQLNADLKSHGWGAEYFRVGQPSTGYDVIYLTPLKDEK